MPKPWNPADPPMSMKESEGLLLAAGQQSDLRTIYRIVALIVFGLCVVALFVWAVVSLFR